MTVRMRETASVHSPQETMVSGTNQLGFGLLCLLAAEKAGENVFLSPLSVLLALAMTYNGAEGRTKAALARLLSVGALRLEDVNGGCRALIGLGQGLEPGVEIDIANAIWVGAGLEPAADFVETIKEAYEGAFASVDFGDPLTADVINRWVAEQTRERIERLVTPELIAQAVMVLTNAVAFKGIWSSAFDEEQTREMVFTLPGGTTRDHSMMSQEGTFDYLETETVQVVELPYGDGRVSMTIVLPKDNVALAEHRGLLTGESWSTWMGSLRPMRGHVALPRFKIEYEAELVPALKTIGGDAITETDFGGMGVGALLISNVIHKTFVDVNEEGTEAAAATAVVMARGISMAFRMVVDRPFFCAMRDRETGLLLFLGWVSDPAG